MKKLLLPLLLLLSGITPLFAQQVDFDKKSGLITVDGKPLFYLMGKNRVLFQSDYSLENLQHQELAYLKAEQQRIYSPGYGYTTETFYSMTFSNSGNYCEIHGLTGFSMFKALAKNIAAARIVQNDAISVQAENKFIVMNNGIFLKDPNDSRYDGDDRMARRDRYNRRNDRSGDNRYYDGSRGGRDDYRDDRDRGSRRDDRNDPGDDRRDNRYDDRNNDNRGNNGRNNADDDNPAPLPIKISIANNKIYDNDEYIGTFSQVNGKVKGEVTVTINDTENRKIATAKRASATTANWQITLIDGTKYTLKYDKVSPLVTLFTSLAEKEYL